jgi:glycosyltransferase involved in cell wall biosynthesis
MSGSTRSHEMAKRLVLMGYDVEIITSTRNNKLEHLNFMSTENGVKINWINVNYSNNMGAIERIISFIKFAFLAFFKAIDLKGDLIFASSTPLTVSLPGIFAARYSGIPFYFEVRDLWPEIPIAMGYLRNPILRSLAIKLEKFSYRNSKGIIALSEGMKDGIVKTGYPNENIVVIPNGADLDLFDFMKSEKIKIREKYRFNQNDIIILYPGTFGQVNNLEYLVDLANEFKTNLNVKFLFVGDGKEKELIVNKAKEFNIFEKNIFLLEPLPKNKISEIFSMCDIVVSTVLPIVELEANSANKFFDALASGTCMVINHGGWLEKELIENNCGFRLPRNIDEAYLKLSPYIKNRNILEEMGRNARKLGEMKYSRDVLAKQLALFFEN